jgi:TATA-box binding protein (TBP) (component of TFIID and TFIIIB)
MDVAGTLWRVFGEPLPPMVAKAKLALAPGAALLLRDNAPEDDLPTLMRAQALGDLARTLPPAELARHERLVTAAVDDPTDVMDVELVNMVHQCYCTLDTAAVAPEEIPEDPDAPRPHILSLRHLQRSWLPLGYHKNEVSTGIGIRFAPPWVASHLTFATARILCTGCDDTANDDALLRHATTVLLRAARLRRLRVQRRVCQNLVAKCQLRAPYGLCLSLLCSRNTNMIEKTKKFVGVKVRHPLMPQARMLGFQQGRVVCIGCKQKEQVRQAFSVMAPIYRASYCSPANILLENQVIARGLVPRIGHVPHIPV